MWRSHGGAEKVWRNFNAVFIFIFLHIFLPRSKEKVFEESMDHLQKDIESLENERGALREKLKGYGNKKGGDLKASTAFGIYF